jgi:molecular chaperone DnaK
MLIHILQGERERAKDNWSLGKFTIEFEQAPKGVPRIGVQFEIDSSGILHVLARDIKTGKETIKEIRSTIDVDDAAVQQMVEDSVEHAFEDLASRRWIELALKARDTIQATQKGILECQNELDSEYLSQLRESIGTVEELLQTEDGGVKTGDAPSLKSQLSALEELTKPLAELLMDKAMESMLKKKGLLK